METSAPLVVLDRVGKVYRGLGRRTIAVDDLTLTLDRSEVVGLAGPNGAGKSTLIALMLGFLRPTSGVLRIGGMAPRAYVERSGIGYLSELVQMPPRWRVEQALVRYALLAGDDAARARSRSEELIARFELEPHRRKQVRQLSKGTLQRVALAQAVMGDEEILILDEPTHGLDPVWALRFRDLVSVLRRPGRLILIASHGLDELERIADRVVILDGGRLRRIVSLRAEARVERASAYRITATRGASAIVAAFPGARAVDERVVETVPLTPAALSRCLAAALAAGAEIAEVTPTRGALEREFRDAVGGGDSSSGGA